MSKKKQELYLAYGSNLNTRQMSFRCPEASLYDVALLPDYELVFRGMPHGAYASIEPHPGMNVPVALWKVSKSDIDSLDSYEGFPRHYRKETVSGIASGKKTDAFVYIMNESMGAYNLPSRTYLQTIYEGYTELGFDVSCLFSAVCRSYLQAQNTFYFNMEE